MWVAFYNVSLLFRNFFGETCLEEAKEGRSNDGLLIVRKEEYRFIRSTNAYLCGPVLLYPLLTKNLKNDIIIS